MFLKCSDKPIRAKWLLFPLRDGRLPKEKDRSIGGPVPFQKPYFVENSLTDWWFGTFFFFTFHILGMSTDFHINSLIYVAFKNGE